MKHVTYQIENDVVEFHNSILGKESLVLNGTKVSEKFSFFGTEHYFKIGDDNYSIRPRMHSKFPWGLGFKLHKNGLPISLEAACEPKRTWTAALLILISLFLGFLTGYFLIAAIL